MADPMTTKRVDALLPQIQSLLRCDNSDIEELRDGLLSLPGDWEQWQSEWTDQPTRKQHRSSLQSIHAALDELAVHLPKWPTFLHAGKSPLSRALFLHAIQNELEPKSLSRDIHTSLQTLQKLVRNAEDALGPKGGGDNTRVVGLSPKQSITWLCLTLFEDFRPGEANSSKDGDTNTLLTLLYEIATGEQDKSLENTLRKVVPDWREQEIAMKEIYDKLAAGIVPTATLSGKK